MYRTIYKRYSLELVEESSEQYNTKKLKDINTPLNSTSIAVTEINNIFRLNKRAEEYMILVCLDTKNYISGIFEVGHGGINEMSIATSNILKRALLINSNKIILCHNHPSGDVTPSKIDYTFTKKLQEAAELVGIQLIDHIIIGKDDYNSLLFGKKGGDSNDRN